MLLLGTQQHKPEHELGQPRQLDADPEDMVGRLVGHAISGPGAVPALAQVKVRKVRMMCWVVHR